MEHVPVLNRMGHIVALGANRVPKGRKRIAPGFNPGINGAPTSSPVGTTESVPYRRGIRGHIRSRAVWETSTITPSPICNDGTPSGRSSIGRHLRLCRPYGTWDFGDCLDPGLKPGATIRRASGTFSACSKTPGLAQDSMPHPEQVPEGRKKIAPAFKPGSGATARYSPGGTEENSPGRRRSFGVVAAVLTVFLELVAEGPHTDAEDFRGAGAV